MKKERIRSRERYQKIKAGEHAVGQPFMLTCKCCGQEICLQADKHPVLRPQLPRKILPAGGGREPQPGVYLRKLRQGVSYDAKQRQILL